MLQQGRPARFAFCQAETMFTSASVQNYNRPYKVQDAQRCSTLPDVHSGHNRFTNHW